MSEPANRIGTIEDCAGRTIAPDGVYYDNDGAIGLRFTDGTWWYAQAQQDWSDGAEIDQKADVSDEAQFLMGLIPEAEFRARAEAYEERMRLVREKHDREEFERLKAKYGEGR
jgi:hypothetical protein